MAIAREDREEKRKGDGNDDEIAFSDTVSSLESMRVSHLGQQCQDAGTTSRGARA